MWNSSSNPALWRALSSALVVLAVSLGGPRAEARAWQGARPEATAPQRAAGVDPALAARWRALPPEGRAELRRRFEALRALPQAERDALVQRARALERLERDVLDELSEAQRARLDAMPAEARRRVLRELALDRARERAERLREVVPAERLEALQRGDRAQRERALSELRGQHEGEMRLRVRRFAEELALPPHEVERLAGLPPEAQRAELCELARRRLEQWVERNGLPPGVDEETWQRLRQAPPEVFARRYGRLRQHFAGRALPHGASAPAAHAWLERLRAACQPTTEERLALAELPPEQRARELGERIRARALTVLRELGVAAEALQRLESLPPGRLRHAARVELHAHLGLAAPPEPRAQRPQEPAPQRARRGR